MSLAEIKKEKKALLTAEHLYKEFPVEEGKKKEAVHAVTDVNLSLMEGETLALVGESGCGKSTLGKTLIRLYDSDGGKILFDGTDITHMKEREFASFRTQMQIIFQDPYASLNPRMNVFQIISEPLRTHHRYSKEELSERVYQLMDALIREKPAPVVCGGAYAILPDADDWVFVNQAAASRCDNVFVLEVRNGRAFEVPHFVYFKNGETCSNDEMVEAVEPIWPRIREIESAQVVPAYDRNGEFLNYEEWDNSPTIGVFRILDSTDYGRFNEAPCGAMVYRR